jgi:hypothetical protein
MPATYRKGTEIWQLVSPGPKRLYNNADELWREASAYFAWCDAHPLYRPETATYQGEWMRDEVPLRRIYTVQGLELYLGLCNGGINTIIYDLTAKEEGGRATARELDILAVARHIKAIVASQQIEGAAVGQFKEGIVSRLNGLSDNVNVKTDKPGVTITVGDKATAKLLDDISDML